MGRMKNNAIVGNIDNEIDMKGLEENTTRAKYQASSDIFEFEDGHGVIVLAEGEMIEFGVCNWSSFLCHVKLFHQPNFSSD